MIRTSIKDIEISVSRMKETNCIPDKTGLLYKGWGRYSFHFTDEKIRVRGDGRGLAKARVPGRRQSRPVT